MKAKRTIVVALVSAAALGTALWFLSAGKGGGDAAQAAVLPAGVEVVQGTVGVSVQAVSVAEPLAAVSLRNRQAGTVIFAAQEGQPVSAGDAVVALDDTDLRKALSQAELNLSQARIGAERAAATESKARTDYAARRSLFEAKAATQEQVDAARDGLAAAEYARQTAVLTVEQAELALEQARRDAAGGVLRAPFDSVVSKVYVSVGDFIPANTQAAQTVDLSKILFRAEVDEYDIGKLTEGLAAAVRIPALNDASFRSRIERISPTADIINDISVFRVSVAVDNAEGRIRPGMSADVTFQISNEKGLMVPSKAVTTVRDRSYVDVLKDDGTAETVRVQIGTSDGRNTIVKEGLEAGRLVALPGAAAAPSTAKSSTGTSVIPISVPGMGQR